MVNASVPFGMRRVRQDAVFFEGFLLEFLPEAVRVGFEDMIDTGVGDLPIAPGEFAFELAGAPAGAAEEDAKTDAAFGANDLLEDLGAAANGETGKHGPFTRIKVDRRVDDEQRGWLNGTADIDEFALILQIKVAAKSLGQGNARGAVDHESHRTVFTVLDHQDGSLEEVRILQAGIGQKELTSDQFGHDREGRWKDEVWRMKNDEHRQRVS